MGLLQACGPYTSQAWRADIMAQVHSPVFKRLFLLVAQLSTDDLGGVRVPAVVADKAVGAVRGLRLYVADARHRAEQPYPGLLVATCKSTVSMTTTQQQQMRPVTTSPTKALLRLPKTDGWVPIRPVCLLLEVSDT